jgi:hypothetical protein
MEFPYTRARFSGHTQCTSVCGATELHARTRADSCPAFQPLPDHEARRFSCPTCSTQQHQLLSWLVNHAPKHRSWLPAAQWRLPPTVLPLAHRATCQSEREHSAAMIVAAVCCRECGLLPCRSIHRKQCLIQQRYNHMHNHAHPCMHSRIHPHKHTIHNSPAHARSP